ncbi:MAG: copper transporter [Bifidobacteriaceae bacterium]|jgi:hypothetical protein|nr:copper transporter [Bifidobacteriaceae bacterium]
MVNFRYHVVSLVAVFLALAVGIVLGAGPLKEPIGSSLADQVSSLRDDRDALRAELEAAEGRGAYADSELAALAPQALDGMLTGRKVALVAIGADLDHRLAALRGGVKLAGAEVTADIRLEDDWLTGGDDPREELAGRLAGLLGAVETEGDRATLALGLATALSGLHPSARSAGADGGANPAPTDTSTSGASPPPTAGASPDPTAGADPTVGADPPPTGEFSPPPSDRSEGTPSAASGGAASPDPTLTASLWEALADSGLASGAVTAPVEAVVVLVGPYFLNPALVLPQEASPAREAACVELAASFARAGLATVVSGPDQAETDLVRRLERDPELGRALSRVVAPLPQAEAIAALWSAAAALSGVHGAYGLVDGQAKLPERLPAPLSPENAGAAGAADAKTAENASLGPSPSPTGQRWRTFEPARQSMAHFLTNANSGLNCNLGFRSAMWFENAPSVRQLARNRALDRLDGDPQRRRSTCGATDPAPVRPAGGWAT